MSIAFFTGFVVGLFLVFLVGYLWKKAGKNDLCKYDERQELQRGRAFKYGFFTLLVYELLTGALYCDEWPKWCDALTFQCIGIGIALLVFVSYCIWKDAYMSLTEQPKKVGTLLAGAILLNLAAGGMNVAIKGFYENGRLNIAAVNLILGVVLIITAVEFLLKIRLDKKEME